MKYDRLSQLEDLPLQDFVTQEIKDWVVTPYPELAEAQADYLVAGQLDSAPNDRFQTEIDYVWFRRLAPSYLSRVSLDTQYSNVIGTVDTVEDEATKLSVIHRKLAASTGLSDVTRTFIAAKPEAPELKIERLDHSAAEPLRLFILKMHIQHQHSIQYDMRARRSVFDGTPFAAEPEAHLSLQDSGAVPRPGKNDAGYWIAKLDYDGR